MRGIVGGLVATLLLVNLGLGGAITGQHFRLHSSPHLKAAPPRGDLNFRPTPERPTSAPVDPRSRAITALLARRAAAILHHDRSAFLADIDPESARFRAAQAAYFSSLQHVPFASWSYTLDAANTAPTNGSQFLRYEATVWLPHVVLHYRLAGFDRSATSLDTYDTFVQRGADWYIGGDNDDADLGYETARDIWDLGPVTVVRGRNVLVLGHPGSPVPLTSLAAEADRDVARVTQVWGPNWSRRVVVLAPNTQTELSKILADGADLTQIAAVATAELLQAKQIARPVGDRVLINPRNYVKLGPNGREIVITHEETHVASRSATGSLEPTWLVEGLADYVGFLDTDISPTVAAHELKDDLDAGRRLGSLPSDASYSGGNKRLAQMYDESWLACRFIAQHWGQSALVRLYRIVGATTHGTETSATDAGMRAVLHEALVTFTPQWRAYVVATLH
jgi:hypothetical protein